MASGSELRPSSWPNTWLTQPLAPELPPTYTMGSLRQTHPFLIPLTDKTSAASNVLSQSVTRSFEDKGHTYSQISTASGQNIVTIDIGQSILKTGISLGHGHVKTVELSILSSPDEREKLVASSMQIIEEEKKSSFAQQEVKILRKIQDLVRFDPNLKKLVYKLIYEYSSPVETNVYTVVTVNSNDYMSVETGERKQVTKNGFPVVEQTLICKYYNGGTLQDRIPFLTRKDRFWTAYCLLKFLDFLHLHLIFHSDLKADNILLKIEKQIINGLEVDVVIFAVIGDYELACDLNDEEDCFYKDGCRPYLSEEFKEKVKLFNEEAKKSNPIESEELAEPLSEAKGSIRKGMPLDESVLKEDVYSMGLVFKQLFESENSIFMNELITQMLTPEAKDRISVDQVFKEFLSSAEVLCELETDIAVNFCDEGETCMFGDPEFGDG